MKARSEFVEPMNFSDGDVFEIRRMFHAASPARSRTRLVAESLRPGFKPTRGSGLGGDGDMLISGDGPELDDIDDDAHAFAYNTHAARETNRSGAAGLRESERWSDDSRFTM